MGKTKRLSVRLTENQLQCLTEICESFNVSYSLLIRTIVMNFLTQYGDHLETIMENRKKVEIEDEDEAGRI